MRAPTRGILDNAHRTGSLPARDESGWRLPRDWMSNRLALRRWSRCLWLHIRSLDLASAPSEGGLLTREWLSVTNPMAPSGALSEFSLNRVALGEPLPFLANFPDPAVDDSTLRSAFLLTPTSQTHSASSSPSRPFSVRNQNAWPARGKGTVASVPQAQQYRNLRFLTILRPCG